MALDIYVGSLTRYYTGEWETRAQCAAREMGLAHTVIRSGSNNDDAPKPEDVYPAIIAWRDDMNQGLATELTTALDWDESPNALYFTERPNWDAYGALLLWAAYSEHSDLVPPINPTSSWDNDAAYLRSNSSGYKTNYPQILRGVEFWFPVDFSFTFKSVAPAGDEMVFGSSVELERELISLNDCTWKSDLSDFTQWGSPSCDPVTLQDAAKMAFAMIFELVRKANINNLIIKLDY